MRIFYIGEFLYESKNKIFIELSTILPLPNTDGPDGPRIVLNRIGMYDPNKYELPELFKATLMIVDTLHLLDDNIIIAGQLGIMDSKGVTMGHLSKFNPLFMKKMSVTFQEANPARIKGLHYVNTPSAFMTLFNVFKTFLNDKVKSRVRKLCCLECEMRRNKFVIKIHVLVKIFFYI